MNKTKRKALLESVQKMKAGCEPVQLAISAKYAGQFKISDAAVGEDDEQQDHYITSLLKESSKNHPKTF